MTAIAPDSALAQGDAFEAEKASALTAYRAGRNEALEQLCRRRLGDNPGDVWAVAALAQVLLARQDVESAVAITAAAVAAAPAELNHRLNLTHFLIQVKRYGEALTHAQVAAEMAPDNARVWINLASSCYHAEQFEASIDASRRALALVPDHHMALNNLATALKAQGRIPEAVTTYRKALALDPNNAVTHTNLLLTLMYDASTPVTEIVEVARQFARQFEAPHWGRQAPFRNVAVPERRLRVGFISPDFSNHAVMYFAEPVLARLPRDQFEVYCYYTYAGSDFIMRRVKGIADHFRTISPTDGDSAAAVIRADEIDILIDIAGHTAKNGLLAMCRKPAPVQATWLGYPGTTGLRGIDWRITDHTADPPGAESLYSEGLIRLPGTFCVYRPHIRSVQHRYDPQFEVKPLPALVNGHITFGCCNNIAKITMPTLDAWGQILSALPTSRLLVEGKDLTSAATSRWLREQLAARGVSEDRLILVSRDPRQQYLTYHRIDIALDPFPLTGGTTTFDAMWMGVPVVTLLGNTFRERLSGTILAGGGFLENITSSPEAYIARVLALAADVPALSQMRSALRTRMQGSVLMDESRFVRLFGDALRGMWRHWCHAQEPWGLKPGQPVPAGQDILINMGGRRITLPSALALIQRWWQGGEQERREATKLAIEILQVVPDQAEATALLRKVRFVSSGGR